VIAVNIFTPDNCRYPRSVSLAKPSVDHIPTGGFVSKASMDVDCFPGRSIARTTINGNGPQDAGQFITGRT
jgi:hypothetical protein